MNLKPYPEYKDSGIQWIGEIPEGWEARRIKMLSYVRRGASPRPIDNLKYFDDDGEYSWVRIADVTASDKYLLNTTEKLSKIGKSFSVPLEPGEIFISIAATVGKPVITKIKCCIHDGFVYFQRLKIDRDYLYYVFVGDEVYKGLGKLGTQLNLNTETIGEIFIPTPLKPEQTTIANFLDKKTAKINSLIEKDEKLIVLLKEKRTALINHAVTKGLDPNVNLKDSGIEWIGEIPERWEVRKVSRSFDFIGSGTTPKTQEDIYYDKGDIPWVITGDLNDGLLKETLKRISKEAVRDYSTLKIYPKNSLIIAMYGATIGKTALLDIEACTNQACCVLAKSKIFETKYVFYWFIANKNNIISYSYGGGQPNISQDIIKTLKIPLPPKPEQQKIVEYLDKATSKIDKTIKLIEQKVNLLQEYKKSLIHQVVTGKMDVRGVEA